ncbi:RNA polymerase sigma factor [Spirosoma fluviale]|uniref:RNA polymerase sigma-70 factor, ECF subfamily n=1 Tax=Spirosoma fluviale TaxID=1597977 RepID=A0A286G8T7_9BACT|nr:sigma-70 family RNA polymerase sigma factor [Spirosoma fluviale]SOD91915.1 RNA polymerase sigma-70 factor, ECF subfamily [Spirosoma fluviale]
MSTRLSDEEMIRQYLPSQPAHCFEALYKRYVNKVYRRCLSMTKDPLKAEDFTHDIFLKVFNKLDAFQERSSFSTWLYSISYNYCSDQIRLARRLQMTDIEDRSNYNIPEVKEELLHEETLHLVNRAMESLSASEQALLRLKYEDGMSITAISELFDLKESTVKMRLKRSRDKIYKLYGKLYAA